MSSSTPNPACRNLVLDAGPLLMLSPLRGLAETFVTVPQVLEELKDKRAREHFEKLGLIAGVNIKVQSPDPASLSHSAHLPYLPVSMALTCQRSDPICKKDGRLFCIITRRSMYPGISLCA
jgi:hypothetical protein